MARSSTRIHIQNARTVLLLAVGSCNCHAYPQELAPASPRVPGPSFIDPVGKSSNRGVSIVCCRMPFTAHKSAFSPDELKALQEAFELAWSDIALEPIISNDPDSARELLAQRIVAAAKTHGERDPERLKRLALKAFQT